LTFNTIYFAKHGNLGGLMKKVFIILLVVILLLSLGFNLKTIREKNYHKEIMISNFYATIIGATRNFESFKTAIDENDIQNAKIQLEYAALGLIEADNQIIYGRIYVDNRVFHPGILSFKFIGEGLVHGTNVNGMTIKSIFADDKVSAQENVYIDWLIKDLKSIVEELTLKEPYIPNEKLSINDFNRVINSFYDNWSHTDKSPYELIWQ
jgi:hypothetical protein